MTGLVSVRVYVRDGCHLCDEALVEIESLCRTGGGFAMEVLDIESDDQLLGRFLERIPVIEVEGETVSELTFDRESFIGALNRATEHPAEYPD